VAIGSQNVKPVGIKQVNLAGIFTKRGEAGGVPRGIKSSANALIGIELQQRRIGLGFPEPS
jgi:hypothetical protein